MGVELGARRRCRSWTTARSGPGAPALLTGSRARLAGVDLVELAREVNIASPLAGVDLVELAREVNIASAGARVLELLAGPTSHN
jgi:hypothetical protein